MRHPKIGLIIFLSAAVLVLAAILYLSKQINALTISNSQAAAESQSQTLIPPTKTEAVDPVVAEPAPIPPLNFLFLGDIMLDRHVGEKIKAKGVDYLFTNLATSSFWNGYDLVGANLEGAVTNGGQHYAPAYSNDFAFAPKIVEQLKKYNFNFFTIANNHLTDQSAKGVLETEKNLTSLGFNFVGAPDATISSSSSKIIEINGQRIGLAGFSMVYHPFDKAEAMKIIKDLKTKSDLVIVNIHWGTEYEHQFSKQQQSLAHEFIDSGADVIIGHHPHVVQGMEVYNNKPIFYSLGNFIFDQYFSSDTQEGLAVSFNFSDQNLKLNLFPLVSKSAVPSLMSTTSRGIFLEKFIKWSKVDDGVKEQIKEGEISF